MVGLDAFEEFDEIEISGVESQPPAAEDPAADGQAAEGTAAEDQEARPQAVDALDEDLFDFPLPDMSHLEPAGPVVSAVPPQADPEPAPAAAGAPPPSSAPAPIAPASPTSPATTSSGTGAAPVAAPVAASAPTDEMGLDDDLFHFPDVFSGALLATPLEDDGHVAVRSDTLEVEEQEPEPPTLATAQPAPLPPARAQATRVPVPEPHFTPQPQTRPPQSPPVPAAAAPAREPATIEPQVTQFEARAPEQPDFEPAPFQPTQPYLPPSQEELAAIAVPAAGRSHLTEILAVGFLILNVALILFAYQANASFHDTLTAVTRSVANSLTDRRASAQEIPPTISFPLPPSIENPGTQLPDGVVDLRLQSMTLARRMVEEERYLDARRVLYRLLANRDLAVLELSFVAEAEYLIAESYELQGKALAEMQR